MDFKIIGVQEPCIGRNILVGHFMQMTWVCDFTSLEYHFPTKLLCIRGQNQIGLPQLGGMKSWNKYPYMHL
jgi:hypothetical protein